MDTWLSVTKVAAFDGLDGFNAAECRFGRWQGSKALPVSKQPLHGGVIALDQISVPFAGDVPDAVKVTIISVIHLANHEPKGLGFVCADLHWPAEPHKINRLVEKGFGSLGISPHGRAEVHYLAVASIARQRQRHLPPTRM